MVQFRVGSVSGNATFATVTLTSVAGGVQVTIDSISGSGDITSVYGEILGNTLISIASITGTDILPGYAATIGAADSISTASNNTNLQGNGINPFDFSVPVGTTGTGFKRATTFTIAGVTLGDFSAQRFGVKLTGNSGSSKLVGNAPLIGRVFNDIDADGIQDSGETGLSGITVYLYASSQLNNDTLTGNFITQAQTDSEGYYSIPIANSGSYVLQFVSPGNYAFSTQNQGTNDKLDSDVNVTTGITAPFTYTAGAQNSLSGVAGSIDAGLVQRSSLSGFVYIDGNNNGVKDNGEIGIGNVQITLSGTDNLGQTVNLTFDTLADGSYNFSNLRPGTYTLTERQPEGFTDGLDTIGSQGGITENDRFKNIVLGFGTVGLNNNFGEKFGSPDLKVKINYVNPSNQTDTNFTTNPDGSYNVTGRSDFTNVLSKRDYFTNNFLGDSVTKENQLWQSDPADNFDGILDGSKYFVQLVNGGSFKKIIEIENFGNGGQSSGYVFKLIEKNSAFAGITNIRVLDDQGNITIDPTNVSIGALSGNSLAGQTNSKLRLEITTSIDTSAIAAYLKTLDFALDNVAGKTDWGKGNGSVKILFDPAKFGFDDGTLGGFSFDSQENSDLSVDLTPNDLSNAVEGRAIATTLTGLGSYHGVDDQSFLYDPLNSQAYDPTGTLRDKALFVEGIGGNGDPYISRTSSWSLVDSNLSLAWLNRPDLDDELDQYIAAQQAGDKATAFDIFINLLVNGGLFDENYSTSQIVNKFSGETILSQFSRNETLPQNGGKVVQNATSGEIISGGTVQNYPIVVFPRDANSGETFNQFLNRINNLGISQGTKYRVDLAAPIPTNLSLQNFSGSNIAIIALPPGSNQLPLINGNGGDNTNLSNTLIAKAISGTAGNYILGVQTGVTVNASSSSNNAADIITGTSGNDAITGANGSDTLNGGRGNDTLIGGGGGDIINGSLGNDSLTGGKGPDIFILRPREGTDTITDFTLSGSNGKDAIGLGGGLSTSNLGRLTLGGNTIIDNKGTATTSDDEILAILTGINTASLSSGNFVNVI
jgi:Ca2+-binding RTX toxin-like protein